MKYISLYVFILAAVSAEKNLIVQLEDGLVEGFYANSYNGRKFASFEGIPFAAAPVGENRFRPPQPTPKWNGTLKANQVYTCIQFSTNHVLGTEDCLYINVYVPKEKLNRDDKLDVVVHIHGGAFMVGTGHGLAGPSKIMDRDVVYVNFNYRLGPFGFLATEDDVFPGNYGLKDQVQALRWVQANIEHFGGNKDSVTIIGLSAGGASVHLHYFSLNTDEVLFHKGWAQSGSAMNPWSLKIDSLINANKLITDVGCKDEDVNVTLRCMRQRTALQIAENIKGTYATPLLPLVPFGPSYELMDINNKEPFLTTAPYLQLKNGKALDRPFIISQTTEEGLLPAALYYNNLEDLDRDWNELAPYMLDFYHMPRQDWPIISEKIKKYYFKGENITKTNFKSFVNLCNQRLFHMGAELSAKVQANVSNSEVYFMMFGYPGANLNLTKIIYKADVEGVGHAFDANYFYEFNIGSRLTAEEEKVKDIMLDFLVSFAKTGKPTSNGIEWNPVGKGYNLKYLLVKNSKDIVMKSKSLSDAEEFWKSLGIKGEYSLY
nr:venom carboxylesterase-6-like [Onthophagus taurus]